MNKSQRRKHNDYNKEIYRPKIVKGKTHGNIYFEYKGKNRFTNVYNIQIDFNHRKKYMPKFNLNMLHLEINYKNYSTI